MEDIEKELEEKSIERSVDEPAPEPAPELVRLRRLRRHGKRGLNFLLKRNCKKRQIRNRKKKIKKH